MGTGLKRKKDGESFNNSFMTPDNIQWFNFVFSEWLPDPKKPLVFLPCGGAFKTRNENSSDTRKFISKGMGHQVMAIITRDSQYERVILSEPLTIIPYSLESHPLRPDYNLPAEDLSIQSEWIFIRQLGMILLKIKLQQPKRQFIYYCGGQHHYFILYFANKLVGEPFKLIYSLKDIARYSVAAENLKKYIESIERKGIIPELEEKSFDDFYKSRGRYTNRAFWESINVIQNKTDKYKIIVTTPEEHTNGFEYLYRFKFQKNPQKTISSFAT